MQAPEVGGQNLLFYLNSAPESLVCLDLARSRFRVSIVPGSFRVILPIDVQAHVLGLPLPRAGRARAAGPEIHPLQTALWDIDISLNYFGRIALSDDLTVPNRFCHFLFRTAFRRSRSTAGKTNL